VQIFHVDLTNKDWLLEPGAPPDATLISKAKLGHIALVHSNAHVLRRWVAEATDHTSAAHTHSNRWAPTKSKQQALDEPLLLILEDDATVDDAPKFLRRMDELLNALHWQSFHAINLLSLDVPICQNLGLHLAVRDATAMGFNLTRPFFATSRTLGVMWSLEGARRTVVKLPSGIAYDIFLRHLMRVNALDMLNSCDGLVREDSIGKHSTIHPGSIH
jgi:hypothetical protein